MPRLSPFLNFISTTDLAKRLGLPTKKICDLFFVGVLDEGRCGKFGGRRAIPESYVDEIEQILVDRGTLPR